MTKTILLDCDYTVFSIAAACQKTIHWNDEIITRHIDLDEARRVFTSAIADTFTLAEADPADGDDILLCFSCPTRVYFRHFVDPTYKSNRKGTAPLGLRELREWATTQWESRTKPGLEADDVLGILGTDRRIIKGTTIIASVDKDLDQIPGLHINPGKPDLGVYLVSPDMGQRQFYYQVLAGDSTDGYPGCPGLGPVRANRVLDNVPVCDDPWRHVVAAYQKAGLTADDAIQQARLARILQAQDYDHTTKEPILWQPPSASSTTSPKTRKSA